MRKLRRKVYSTNTNQGKISMHPEDSFPVGKVDFLTLHPLNFTEFLLAMDEHGLVELIEKHEWELTNSFKSKLTNYLRYYLFVGGMHGPRTLNQLYNGWSIRDCCTRYTMFQNQRCHLLHTKSFRLLNCIKMTQACFVL